MGAHSIPGIGRDGLRPCEPMTGSHSGAGQRGGFAAGRARGVGAQSIPGTVSSLRSEPMTGIEPAYLAWEASALPLSYIGQAR